MTREHFADLIGWSWIVWTFALMNVGAMIPQLVRIMRTKNVAGLSLGMFLIFLSVQIGFGLEGYFQRNTMLMTSSGLSALASLSIITLILCFRRKQPA